MSAGGHRPDLEAIVRDPDRYGIRIAGGALYVEGVELAHLANEIGTPAYVYGAGHVEQRYRELEESLRGHPSLICYAIKANSSQAILRHLGRLGAGADIVSGGELQRVLAAGIGPNKIVFSGVGKRDAEIDAAVRAGILSINVESPEELERVAARALAAGEIARVSLRINPDVDPNTHPYLATGLREAKFGIPMADAREVAKRANVLEGIELVGIACHIGSQIVESSPFLDSLARLRSLVAELETAGHELRYVDLGGGLGIRYAPDDPVLDAPTWGKALTDAMEGLRAELIVEPGRYLVGNAGVLLTRVLTRKRGEDKTFVIVDAAMNDLLRPALYEAYHAIVPAKLPRDGTPAGPVDVVGPVCECGDFFARERMLHEVQVGDVLAVLSAGAYGMTMASSYNTRPVAPEIMVRGDQFHVTRHRASVIDLIAAESYPDWLG